MFHDKTELFINFSVLFLDDWQLCRNINKIVMRVEKLEQVAL